MTPEPPHIESAGPALLSGLRRLAAGDASIEVLDLYSQVWDLPGGAEGARHRIRIWVEGPLSVAALLRVRVDEALALGPIELDGGHRLAELEFLDETPRTLGTHLSFEAVTARARPSGPTRRVGPWAGLLGPLKSFLRAI